MDRRIQAVSVQDSVCEAFLLLAKEKPYDRLTVTTVCEAARTSRRAFYNHFEGLFDVACECWMRSAGQLPDQVRALSDGTLGECVLATRRSIGGQVGFLAEHKNLARVIAGNMYEPPFSRFTDIDYEYNLLFCRAIVGSCREPSPFISAEEAADCMMQNYWLSIRSWCHGGMAEPVGHLADRLTRFSYLTASLVSRDLRAVIEGALAVLL